MQTKQAQGWIPLSRELIADLLELFDAELGEARLELSGIGKKAVKVAALFALAGFVLFWLVAGIGYAGVQALALVLPLWLAAVIVVAAFALIATLLAIMGWSQAKRLANPIDVIVGRLRGHLDWWRSDVALHSGTEEGTDDGDVRRVS